MRQRLRWWRSLAALLLLTQTGLVYAEKLAELSDDFLEYLGSLEGDDENWTDFSDTVVAGKQSSSSKSVAAESIKASSASSSAASVMSKATAQITTPASGKVER